MNCPLLWIALLVLATFAPCGRANTLRGKTQQLASPGQVPEGLAKSDWQSIRAAYESGRQAFQPVKEGWEARNPGQQWVTKFDHHGFTVVPDAEGWTWGLELVGYGEASEVHQEGGRISYAKGDGLTEWFVNDTRGLEQGWTLARRPASAGTSGPVRLDLRVRGGLRPRVSPEGASVAFMNEAGGAAVNYGGLKAWDFDGKTVPVRFVESAVRSGSFVVLVDDAGAKYPITVDPIAQQAYLKASNIGEADSFGYTVAAVSGDTVVVGAPQEDSNAVGVNGNQVNNLAVSSGAAYVFTRSGSVWTQQAYLKASNTVTASNTGAGDYFGWSVAVSGGTVVVGAYVEDSNATGVNGDGANDLADNAGAAYVFARTGTAWTQLAYLKASNTGVRDGFGHAVAVSGDTVVIGAPNEDSAATGVNGNQGNDSAGDAGAAYVFMRTGTVWRQQAYLKASNTRASDYFGSSVGVSADTVVVGAPTAAEVNGNPTLNPGAAYVFTRSGTGWTLPASLKGSNTGEDDLFGYSVAVSGDTVVVGAYVEDSNATGVNGNLANNLAVAAGAAYVFTRKGAVWTRQAYLKASNTEAFDQFGHSVSVSGDTVVVGTFWEDSETTGVNGNQADNSAPSAGAAYVFGGLGPASFSPMEQWRQFRFGTTANSGSAADGFDFDGDGLVNLLEWAAGSHPKHPNTYQPGMVRNGASLVFTYPRSLAAFNAGTGYAVEWSGTLAAGSWQTIGVTQSVFSTVGDVQTVRATVSTGTGRRYLRLRVTPP